MATILTVSRESHHPMKTITKARKFLTIDYIR